MLCRSLNALDLLIAIQSREMIDDKRHNIFLIEQRLTQVIRVEIE
jgi:hypothetical protein